jgi:predicted hotdog family 3-hydroxylacyl-ACP dehydratase
MMPSIDELVPHARPALLLDRVVESLGDDALVTETSIREDNPYCEGGRVGAWIGIELIAQSVAALAGLDALRGGRPVKIGFLLGTRRYRSAVAWFAVGQRLRIEVTREFQSSDGLGAASGRILGDDDRLLGEGLLTVFQPARPEDVIGR